MTEFLPRTAWTKGKAGGAVLDGKQLLGVSVHYPGSGNEALNGLSKEQIISRLTGWRRYHVEVRGWSDIGYQVAIDGSGRVWDLRGITRVPSASASISNSDANKEWGACLFIVGDHETPTGKAIQAFRDWHSEKWLKQWPHAVQISGHGDVPGAQTSCPGEWLRQATRDGSILENESEEVDDVNPLTIVATDKDGSPMTMGELATRLSHFVGGPDAATLELLNDINSKLDALLKAQK